MLANVLVLAINLVSLLASPGPSNIIFHHCTFPLLHIFSTVLVLLEELRDFLTSHPSITQLCIDREVSHQHLALPPSALPTLETYLGSC